MSERKIGVMIESFRMGVEDGIRKAAEVGADGFQIFCTSGQMAPENMSQDQREEFKRFVAEHRLTISALCADYFKGFLNPETNPDIVEKTLACMDLASDLGVKVITSHIGTLPEDDTAEEWEVGLEAMNQIAEHGKKTGVRMASETGPESAEVLKRFLDRIPGKVVGVNYDPANLVMGGFDQIGGVEVLADYIFHTHAKDGTREPRQEVPLGKGEVDFPAWIAALDGIGYEGFLTIEREVGETPVKDITEAMEFLRGF